MEYAAERRSGRGHDNFTALRARIERAKEGH